MPNRTSRNTANRIEPDRLRRRTSLTSGATPSGSDAARNGLFGQTRAREAIELAAAMSEKGFNLFVAAPPGAHATSTVRAFLEEVAADHTQPDDWVYVSDFDEPYKPRALRLPPGRAKPFRQAMRDLIIDLVATVPAALEKPDFQARRKAIEDQFNAQKEDAFEQLGDEARDHDVAIIQTPMGFSLAPLKDGEVLNPKDFKALPEDEQKARQDQMRKVQEQLGQTLREFPKWERETRHRLRDLERETVEAVITDSINETEKALDDLKPAIEHLKAMREDLLENIVLFTTFAAHSRETGITPMVRNGSLGPLERYDVNVLVANDTEDAGAPVIEEPHPNLSNLVGRVEHRAEEGVLTTSFMLIKPGALHLANGGFLIVDVRSLLREPVAWDALKRSLRQSCVKIESLGEALNLSTTITLEPEPIGIDVRVVLVGDAWIHYVLSAIDPDFSSHFKLLADFETDTARTPETEADFAATLAVLAQEQGMLPLESGALERLVEEASRMADNSAKLTLVTGELRDLIIEASHYARSARKKTVGAETVSATIAARRKRLSRISERMQEGILDDVALIDTAGEVAGQINCLSVFQIGNFRFGKPTRVTARTRPGSGRIIDIERESSLGGPIHSKGVMILSGYLAGRYAAGQAMTLHASLVFEQSYGGVEGDSASLGELCALLSSLSDIPIRQGYGITGSVNQLGKVQAIGGVNEKIEGFFDICKARGLTGDQGVIIPVSNVPHLMLDTEVVAACEAEQFSVFAVESVDDAIALLTGQDASIVHEAVETTLAGFADIVSKSGLRGETRTEQKQKEPSSGGGPPGAPPGDAPDEPPPDPPVSTRKGRASS